jgi:hypothetical protein
MSVAVVGDGRVGVSCAIVQRERQQRIARREAAAELDGLGGRVVDFFCQACRRTTAHAVRLHQPILCTMLRLLGHAPRARRYLGAFNTRSCTSFAFTQPRSSFAIVIAQSVQGASVFALDEVPTNSLLYEPTVNVAATQYS